MKTNRIQPRIFIVVKVHSGIPIVAEAFLDERAAERRAARLEIKTNPEYDEVQIFETVLK